MVMLVWFCLGFLGTAEFACLEQMNLPVLSAQLSMAVWGHQTHLAEQ